MRRCASTKWFHSSFSFARAASLRGVTDAFGNREQRFVRARVDAEFRTGVSSKVSRPARIGMVEARVQEIQAVMLKDGGDVAFGGHGGELHFVDAATPELLQFFLARRAHAIEQREN